MQKRIIFILILLLLLGGCAARPADAAPVIEYTPEVTELLEGFDPEGGRPQPYGLPPSYAPEEVWEAVRSETAQRVYLRHLQKLDQPYDRAMQAALERGECPEIAGGYQEWCFRSDELTRFSDGKDLFALLTLETRWSGQPVWYFFLCGNDGPHYLIELHRLESGDYLIWRVQETTCNLGASLRTLTRGIDPAACRSPVLILQDRRTYGSDFGDTVCILRTEEGDRAVVGQSLKPVEGIYIIGFEQERVSHSSYGYKHPSWAEFKLILPYDRQAFQLMKARDALQNLPVGFGVYLALLLCGTVLLPTLWRKRRDRRTERTGYVERPGGHAERPGHVERPGGRMERPGGRSLRGDGEISRLWDRLLSIVTIAALVLAAWHALLWCLPQNRYLSRRYGADFRITLISGAPVYNRYGGIWIDPGSLPLTGTPDRILSAEGITAEVRCGPERLRLNLTNTGEIPKGLVYVLIEEQFRGRWYLCATENNIWDGETVRAIRAGKVPERPTQLYLSPGSTGPLLIGLGDANREPRLQPPRGVPLRAVLIFSDGTYYAAEFMR